MTNVAIKEAVKAATVSNNTAVLRMVHIPPPALTHPLHRSSPGYQESKPTSSELGGIVFGIKQPTTDSAFLILGGATIAGVANFSKFPRNIGLAERRAWAKRSSSRMLSYAAVSFSSFE